MDLTIANNTIRLPGIAGIVNQDGDGIDLNIGANATLNATLHGNDILALGIARTKDLGDNGLTFDIRSNAVVDLAINNNYIDHSGDAAIGFSLQNTTFANQPGLSRISFSANSYGPNNPALIEVDLVSNPGIPISNFYLTTNNVNQINSINERAFNPGLYPALFINNTRWQ